MAQHSPEKLATISVGLSQPRSEIANETPDLIASNIFSNLTTDECKQYVSTVARYLLMGQNRGTPIKRKEVQEQIGPTHSRAVLPILKAADKVLRDTAGLAVVEFTKGTNKFYILINKLDMDPDLQKEFVERDPQEAAQMSLLLVILSLLMMKQARVKEEDLWEFLMQLDIPSGDVQHPVLGNVKKLLEEWTKQMYLEKSKESTPDKAIFHYTWGERAKAEFPPEKILRFVAKVHGDDPRNWLRIHKHLLGGNTEIQDTTFNTNDSNSK